MTNHRFTRLLSELTTRESSTLVIATVASSASLVLWAAPCECETNQIKNLVGYLFPLLGFTYRELTIRFDKADYDDLKSFMPKKELKFLREELNFKIVASLRGFILRCFLLLPSVLWAAEVYNFLLFFALAVVASFILTLNEWIENKEKKKRWIVNYF